LILKPLVEWSPAMAARIVRCLFLAAVFTSAITVASRGFAQEFRVETDIYVGESTESSSHTVTLFEKSAVYEFVDNPKQIVIFRSGGNDRSGQFILLDLETQRRTDVDVERVSKLMTKLNRWAAEQKDPLMKFSAKPSFEETFDAEHNSLTLASPEWTYRVAAVKVEDDAAAKRYQEFMDHYAALSSMVYNSAPPGPRIALDAALAKRNVVPVEIHRTTGGEGKNAVRSTQMFTWRLSREDRNRLDETQTNLANFKKVDNEEFIAARAEKSEKGKAVIRGQSK
jgi:hypothetical protein